MEGAELGCLVWLEAIYLHLTSIKNISAMKLRRDLGISYTSAWFISQRLRESFAFLDPDAPLSGEVEADERCLGGCKCNMHAQEPRRDGQRGSSGKVAGIKERGSGRITVKRVRRTTKGLLQSFVRDNVVQRATVCTDEHSSYVGLSDEFIHEAMKHGVGEFVRKIAHTNDIEGTGRWWKEFTPVPITSFLPCTLNVPYMTWPAKTTCVNSTPTSSRPPWHDANHPQSQR